MRYRITGGTVLAVLAAQLCPDDVSTYGDSFRPCVVDFRREEDAETMRDLLVARYKELDIEHGPVRIEHIGY